MRHILLPTDFSNNANHAIDYAVQLFGLKDTTYHVFYTYAIPVVTSEVAYAPIEHYEKEGSERLDKEIIALHQKHPGITLEKHLEFGDIPTALDKLTLNTEFDAVVMGTSGSSGLKEFFFGSNTYDLIDNTSLPVYVVPQDCKCSFPKNVVFASDLKPFKSDSVIQPLVDLIQQHDIDLTVLNVKSDTDSFTVNQELNHIDNLFGDDDMNICFDDSDNPVDGIERYVSDFPTDLVVALKRKKNFLQDLFGKSITRDLTFHLKTPMLILHEQ